MVRLRPCIMKKSFAFVTVNSTKNKQYKNKGFLMKSKDIALETTNKELSSNAGLILFNKIFEELNLPKRLSRILPKKKRNRGPDQINKFKALLFSFAAGSDSISDLDHLNNDKLFLKLTDGGVASRTMGDFLRSLRPRKIELLQDLLIDMAFALRQSIHNDNNFILSMDATPHEHFGKKMEGLDWNYKSYWCLDSQNAYDQYGFSYLFDLRPGNTHSGKDSELWIKKIFDKIPAGVNRYFRADSAYAKNIVYEALKAAKTKFTIVLNESVAKTLRDKNKNFLKWKKSNLYFFGSDDCEVAMGLYPIQDVGNFRVVFMRAPKKNPQTDIFEDSYDYYSIITNISSSEKSDEEIIKFYRGRANAENFIKEQKYGFDFLHFPCQQLNANKVYGLIGTFCHNMMRYLSFCMPSTRKRVRGKDQKIKTIIQKGYYAKKVRNNLIKLPCQVVCHARKVILKINPKTKEVLDNIMINLFLQSSLPTS